jgi:hypothetical protein
MPIEIRELIIRAVVDRRPEPKHALALPEEFDRDALIQACVDETLRVLRRRDKER